MADVGVSITKSAPFRNFAQEFSNVYFYHLDIGVPNEAEAGNLIDAIVAIEKTFHSSSVSFVRGRCWSQIGTKEQNEMLNQHNLSGTGARSPITMDRERAFLFRIRAGVDSRGNPVYLRKWFHACGEFVSGQGVSTNVLEQSSGWSQAQRDAQVAAMQGLRLVTVGASVYRLRAKSGREFDTGANFTAHQYLEHHQLGDQWRAQ